MRKVVTHLQSARDAEQEYLETRNQRRLADDELKRKIHEKEKELKVIVRRLYTYWLPVK
jgi:hypothetical protein